MDEQRKSFRALLSFLVCALLLLFWGLLFLGDSFVGACLQAMVRGVLATYRQQAGSHKVYGTWLLLLLLVIGCFVGAFLQAMVGVVLAVYRQQAGSHKVCGTWLLVLCYYCWLFCGSLPASDGWWCAGGLSAAIVCGH